MDAERWEQVQTFFFAALDRGPEAWGAFLDEACIDDATLRAEVEAMLNVHEDSQALAIEGRLFAEGPPRPDPEALLGTRVGPYRLKRLLGRGGMGEVYLAERDDAQYRQQVALKLVRPGFGRLDLIARFRTERQILARLIHPHIARLLDGGMTDEGRPYLVMPYIEGVPLTTFCNTHRLSIEERLRLFRQVCDAVQFAHRNLVVHRDLKPSNILVTAAGEVKLLDFGIAKLLDPEAVEVSVAVTRSEIRVMTPEYAAPEQVRGEAITTATDVYALGVLLYELLTDHRPYRLARRAQAEIERIICEEEPKRPSTAVTEMEEIRKHDGTRETVSPEQVSTARRVPVSRLQRLLRGDLDNMVMMTLRKEPARRYASVEALSEDVLRFLEGHPVTARPDTVGYRVRKFVRRNRIGVGVAAAFVLLLVGFSIVTARQARTVAHERDVAQDERDKAEEVTTFVLSLFETADPRNAPGDTMMVRDVLEAGAERIETQLADQPAVQAEMLSVIGQAYQSLGRPDRAEAMLTDALALRQQVFGEEHEDVAASLHELAALVEYRSDFPQAEALWREYLALQRKLHGDAHPGVLIGLYKVASVLHILRRGAEADSLFEVWLEVQQRVPEVDDPDLVISMVRMGEVLSAKRRHEEAEALLRRALAMERRLVGGHHSRVGWVLNRLGFVLNDEKKYAEAEELAREAVTLHRILYPEGHRNLAHSLTILGLALQSQTRYDEVDPLFHEALAIYLDVFGENHHEVGYIYRLLGRLFHDRGDYDEAETFYQKSIAVYETLFGSTFLVTLQCRAELGDLLRDKGDYEAAEHILLGSYQTLEKQRGREDRFTQAMAAHVVALYEAWGKPDKATAYRE